MDFTTLNLMPDWLFAVLGWVPAVIFPAASGLQLLAILHRRSAQGVSIPAWGLFAVANLCLFVYTEKYDEVESIIGALGTSVLNVCIVIAALKFRAHTKSANVTTPSACLALVAAIAALLMAGCLPQKESPAIAKGAPPTKGAQSAQAKPPPAVQAWMDRLTVPHDYDPKTGFIVAREVTPLPPILAGAPPLDRAIAEAGSTRTVIVFVTADRCAPCQQYKKDAVNDAAVIARLSDARFVPTHLEVDRSPKLAETYLGTTSIPMTYALRGGIVVAQLRGQRSAAELLAWIDGLP